MNRALVSNPACLYVLPAIPAWFQNRRSLTTVFSVHHLVDGPSLVLKGICFGTVVGVTQNLQQLIKRGDLRSLISLAGKSRHRRQTVFDILEDTLTAGNSLSPNPFERSHFDSRNFRAWCVIKIAHAFCVSSDFRTDYPEFQKFMSSFSQKDVKHISFPPLRGQLSVLFQAADALYRQVKKEKGNLGGDLDEQWKLARTFQSELEACIAGKSMLITKSRSIGLASDNTRVGDEIWFLIGGKVPFILRRLENGNHAFIGELYLKGYMRGEICKDGIGPETKFQTVNLQ